MAQVIVMERLRQAVWHGLEEKLGADKTSLQYNMASSLSGGRIFAAPTAYLRPNISSHGRGKKEFESLKLWSCILINIDTQSIYK